MLSSTERYATLGELKASGYQPRSVKEEIRTNLIRKLSAGEALFPGVVGYDDRVVPQIVNADPIPSGQRRVSAEEANT